MDREERLRRLMEMRGEVQKPLPSQKMPQKESGDRQSKAPVSSGSKPSRQIGTPAGSSQKTGAGSGSTAGNKAPARKMTARMRQQRREQILRLSFFSVVGILIIIIAAVSIRNCMKPKTLTVHGETEASSCDVPSILGGLEGETKEAESDTEASGEDLLPSAEHGSDPEESLAPEDQTQDSGTVTASSASGSVDPASIVIPDWITQDFLTPNPMSRPQTPISDIRYIAIHYTANPMTTAKQNRSYFENLGNPEDPAYGTAASAHLIVGLEGEIIQCIPLYEWANAVHDEYNPYTISVEVCIPSEDGKFTDISIAALNKLVAWLLQQFNLDDLAIIRHYDCDWKLCPKYYVEHEDAWVDLKAGIMEYYHTHPNIT